MGFPGNTVDMPGNYPGLAVETEQTILDLGDVRHETVVGLTGGPCRSGQLCVNAWLFNESGSHMLLVRHPRFGWSPPGGHVELGETAHQAATRELAEETGILDAVAYTMPAAVYATLLPAKGADVAHVHYCLGFVFTATMDATLTSEVGQPVAWFDVTNLPDSFFGDNDCGVTYFAAVTGR